MGTYNPGEQEFIVSNGSSWLIFWDRDTLQEKRKIRVQMDYANNRMLAKKPKKNKKTKKTKTKKPKKKPTSSPFKTPKIKKTKQNPTSSPSKTPNTNPTSSPSKTPRWSNRGYLNELEYWNGYILANIWYQNYIVIINPSTGLVEQTIDFTSLVNNQGGAAGVLNGISVT